jgi:hypothetical protein
MSHPDLNQESVHSAAHTQALSGCQEILPGFGVTGKRAVGYRVRDRGRETVRSNPTGGGAWSLDPQPVQHIGDAGAIVLVTLQP